MHKDYDDPNDLTIVDLILGPPALVMMASIGCILGPIVLMGMSIFSFSELFSDYFYDMLYYDPNLRRVKSMILGVICGLLATIIASPATLVVGIFIGAFFGAYSVPMVRKLIKQRLPTGHQFLWPASP